ncbi:MAG: DNA cytosine methyltransferase [Anaerobiospirillum succiniciproducens]|uniref:DNA cytosine methyltransferase n=1 Tax=Anaerobiospirillum succiniciproducens TaxID=13335 RepID=UPI002A763E11|nr:DNA cytosine methyltransferase [Anaerobiospirillum succiniciproducens]MDY2798534.1 DNA cytosine methyltransferase [Anaerobiospirillum succiniciproducens]
MRSLELFAGLGGMAKGLELAGFDAVKLVELNHQACNSLRANFNPDLVFEGDVRAFDATPFAGIDLLAGGPPCQPSSLGGLSKAHHDERDMFPNTARILAQCCPKAFIFENVKGV